MSERLPVRKKNVEKVLNFKTSPPLKAVVMCESKMLVKVNDAELFDVRKLHHLNSVKKCQIVVFIQRNTSTEIRLKFLFCF